MAWDKEIGLPVEGSREDGGRGEGSVHREIGELMLSVDELEDTLYVLESRGGRPGRGSAEEEMIRRIGERIRAERAKLAAIERRGELRYDEIERAIRLADAMG